LLAKDLRRIASSFNFAGGGLSVALGRKGASADAIKSLAADGHGLDVSFEALSL
jgi:hypothetical protein